MESRRDRRGEPVAVAFLYQVLMSSNPEFHRSPGQRQSEMTDPSEDINIRTLAFDICGANATSFDPCSTDRAESRKVVLTVFHQCQVCDERDVYAEAPGFR